MSYRDQDARIEWMRVPAPALRLRRWLLNPLTSQFNRLEYLMAASQADIDALSQQVSDLKTSLTAADAAIQQEIEALRAQGVDVSGLQAAVAGLSDQVDATSAMVPTAPPAPAPDQPTSDQPTGDAPTGNPPGPSPDPNA